MAQLAIKNLSKLTIRRGALKFATQISPLLNCYQILNGLRINSIFYSVAYSDLKKAFAFSQKMECLL